MNSYFQPLPAVNKDVPVVIKETKTDTVRPTNDEKEDEERLKIWRTHILEENNNVKESRARACKGQRYREFMWTNYTTRRKSNRYVSLNWLNSTGHIVSFVSVIYSVLMLSKNAF